MRTHQELDLRSLAMHRLVAARIRDNPVLLERVKGTLVRWRSLVDVNTVPYLDAWEHLVDQGVEACLAVATEDSERAAALRQSSPFTGILSNQERWEFLKNWTDDHAA